MSEIEKAIIQAFGNKLRLRVSGLLIENNKVLLINHHNLGSEKDFWSPPGGGLNFGESIENCLKREFLEETNLTIEIGPFVCVNEFLSPPLHAIELFFFVNKGTGSLQTGNDPELEVNKQIIKEANFLGLEELLDLPKAAYHNIFHSLNHLNDLSSVDNFTPTKKA